MKHKSFYRFIPCDDSYEMRIFSFNDITFDVEDNNKIIDPVKWEYLDKYNGLQVNSFFLVPGIYNINDINVVISNIHKDTYIFNSNKDGKNDKYINDLLFLLKKAPVLEDKVYIRKLKKIDDEVTTLCLFIGNQVYQDVDCAYGGMISLHKYLKPNAENKLNDKSFELKDLNDLISLYINNSFIKFYELRNLLGLSVSIMLPGEHDVIKGISMNGDNSNIVKQILTAGFIALAIFQTDIYLSNKILYKSEFPNLSVRYYQFFMIDVIFTKDDQFMDNMKNIVNDIETKKDFFFVRSNTTKTICMPIFLFQPPLVIEELKPLFTRKNNQIHTDILQNKPYFKDLLTLIYNKSNGYCRTIGGGVNFGGLSSIDFLYKNDSSIGYSAICSPLDDYIKSSNWLDNKSYYVQSNNSDLTYSFTNKERFHNCGFIYFNKWLDFRIINISKEFTSPSNIFDTLDIWTGITVFRNNIYGVLDKKYNNSPLLKYNLMEKPNNKIRRDVYIKDDYYSAYSTPTNTVLYYDKKGSSIKVNFKVVNENSWIINARENVDYSSLVNACTNK